ncbi:hypothetical protein D3C79_512160 [compost metagenome]
MNVWPLRQDRLEPETFAEEAIPEGAVGLCALQDLLGGFRYANGLPCAEDRRIASRWPGLQVGRAWLRGRGVAKHHGLGIDLALRIEFQVVLACTLGCSRTNAFTQRRGGYHPVFDGGWFQAPEYVCDDAREHAFARCGRGRVIDHIAELSVLAGCKAVESRAVNASALYNDPAHTIKPHQLQALRRFAAGVGNKRYAFDAVQK